MAEDYQVLEELGSGSFGTVYRARHTPSGEEVAIKHIDLEGSDDDIQDIQQEIALLATCHSDYVTQYRTSFVRGTKLWIVMEFLGGGSCLDLLKPFPRGMEERYIAVIVRELLLGLDYLHSTGKIHRDIKAANVLLSATGRVKIADFGVAAQLTNIKSQRLTFVGTPFWMAPEVIQEAGYDFGADIWSLGITAMEMAMGEPPRSDVHPMKVLFLIPKERPPRLEGNRWSIEFKNFVALCLNKEAEKRPSARALLKHPFVRRAGSTELLQELLLRAQEFERNGGTREKDVRFYEQTLKAMNTADDGDDWVFDTVKPAAQQHLITPTVKRRKVERVMPADVPDVEYTTTAMEKMHINGDSLMDAAGADTATPTELTSTIRKTNLGDITHSQRRPSTATSRRVSTSSPTVARQTNRRLSSATADPSRTASTTKPPLGLDLSFGNGRSTTRQFQRVASSGSSGDADVTPSMATEVPAPASPQDSVFDSDAENKPPPNPNLPASATSKDAQLGRRSYAKCIAPALTEALASSAAAGSSERAAMVQVAEAWAALDAVSPEAELALLKRIVDRVQADPRLAGALLPARVATTQLGSLRTGLAAASAKRSTSTNHQDGGDGAGVASPGRRTPLRPSAANAAAPPRRPADTPPTPPVKLVLNPQNPHLRKMQSSASQPTSPTGSGLRPRPSERLEDKKLPTRGGAGHDATPGMEHITALADALYARWSEGLKARWPAA